MADSCHEGLVLSSRRYFLYLLISVVAGALTTLAFAPYDQVWLVFVTLAVMLVLWQQLTPKQAWFSGWLYGIGLQCSGVGWIYYSLHVHGGTPPAFAAVLIFLLACYLSIYTGFAAWVVTRFCPQKAWLRLLFFYPAAWVVFEWLQGIVMTGFAWMQTGYTQIDWPLAGYSPVIGNHGVSGLVMMSAGALALLAMQRRNTGGARLPAALKPLLLVAVIWLLGAGLKTIDWTQPQGQAITVGIVQGNVPQSIKWRKSMRQPTLDRYRQLTAQLPGDIDLIIWPETAVPDFWYRVQPYIRDMKQRMQARNSDLLLGIFVKNDDLQLLNSVLNVNGESYHKRHLVPLGEFIPLRFLIDFFRQWVDIPMSDIASGEEAQPLLTVKGIPLGLSICFEEAFARDVLTTLPQAQILVNLSNDAWFEDSHEPHQHHVIARMRALESGRYMVRSTNTGISAIIDPKGKVISRAPQFEVAVLTGRVQPYSGSTPYVVWGDYFILLICLSALVFCWVKGYTFKKA